MLKKHPIMLYLTWIVVLIIIPLPVVVALNTGLVESAQNRLVYDLGVVAYVWWLVIVGLSTRPQWLDRYIGLPAMYFVHGMLGVLALGLATLHVLNSFSMDPLIKNLGNVAWYLAIFGVAYAALFMSGWLVDRFKLAARTKQTLQFIFKHQISVWIHRLNFIVIGLIWLHVHLIGRVSRITDFIIIFDIYTVVSLGLYAWKKFVASASDRLTGQVISNKMLADRVLKIEVKLGSKARKYRAGDFYFLSILNASGVSKEAHPFSVSTAPLRAPQVLQFTIQTRGDYTSSLKNVNVGSDVRLEGPFGRFDSLIKKTRPEQSLVLIAMGTGIAPLLSVAQQYQASKKIRLLWSAHQNSDFYYQKTLDELQNSAHAILIDQHVGRYTIADFKTKITTAEINHAQFVIVGPALGVIDTEKKLKKIGVKARQLIDERLTM